MSFGCWVVGNTLVSELTSPEGEDVGDSGVLRIEERLLDALLGKVRTRQVHHHLEATEVLRARAEFEREVGSAATSSPRHV